MKCAGCGAKSRKGGGHSAFIAHEDGCRWEHRSREGRKPGGQPVPL